MERLKTPILTPYMPFNVTGDDTDIILPHFWLINLSIHLLLIISISLLLYLLITKIFHVNLSKIILILLAIIIVEGFLLIFNFTGSNNIVNNYLLFKPLLYNQNYLLKFF